MIRMTRQADYGIVLMTRIAARPDHMYNAPELAAVAQIPQPTVSKILKQLAREGLLVSHRGMKGGYTLARPAEQITVAEMITALEGPIAITECIDDSPGDCRQEPFCPVRGNWQRINEAIRGALDSIRLSEMVHPLPSNLVPLGRSDRLARRSGSDEERGERLNA